jgi:hypothetical protein
MAANEHTATKKAPRAARLAIVDGRNPIRRESAREATRLSIARPKSNERHAVLCDLEAQIAGALSLIGIEYRDDDPNGSLLCAALLLQKALEMSEDLRNLILQPEKPAHAGAP